MSRSTKRGETILRGAVASALLILLSSAVSRAQLTLDMRVTPDPVQPGELLRYEFTVTAGSGAVSNVTLHSQTSASTTLVSTDRGTCNFSDCRAASVVTWSLGTLSPGQSVTRKLISRVGASVPAGTMVFNTAQATASNAPQVDVSRSVTVDPARNLALAIVAAAEPAVPGEMLTYIVDFANRGTTADAGVVLRAAVPAGTQFVSATQGGSEQDGVVSWSLGTIAVGQSGERRFVVEVSAAPPAVFSAADISDALNPGVVLVRAETATPVQMAPPLTLDMTVTPDPVQPGELLRYELTVRNRSQITVSTASLQDQTLDGTTLFSVDGGSCNFSDCRAGSVVTWSLGTLSPGQSVQRQLILRAGATLPAGTLAFNAARVTGSGAPEAHCDRAVPVDPTRALAVAIAETTEPAVPGEPLTYVVSFANRGTTAAAGVVLQAPVPDGAQFVSATQGGGEQDGVVQWSLGTVGVGQSGERRFVVQVTDAAAEAVFGAAELSDAVEPGAVRVRAEAAAPVLVAPPLTLDMTVTPDPVQPGELLRYELTVRNRSQITVSGARLQDQTLDGTTLFSLDGGSCNFSDCRAGSVVTWSLGTLSPGQSVQRQVILRAGATLPAGTLVANTAHLTASNALEVHADRTVPVDPARALAVAITEATEPAVPGEPLTYVVSFANRGTTAAAGVVLQAAILDGAQFVSATQGGTEQDGVVRWSLGTIAVGQNGERRFAVQVADAATEAVFGAAELSDTLDPETVRARAEAAAPVYVAPPLTLSMTVTPDPVQPGELLRYELTVRNRSQITVSAASLQDQTLDGTTLFSLDGGSCNFSDCRAGSVVTWSLGTLSPGQSVQRQLVQRAGATLPAGTLVANTAHLTASNAPEVHADRAVPVDPARTLAVAIAEVMEPAVPGELLTYVVSFANRGTTAAAGVILQAAVPDGAQFVSATQGGTEQHGVVTWSLGSIAVGQSGERGFSVAVPVGTREVLFSAAELTDAIKPDAVRARAEAVAPVLDASPVALEVTLTPNPVAPNALVHYDLTVRNSSEIVATAAVLQDLTFDGTTITATNGGSCNFSDCRTGSVVTWSLGNLGPGESTTRALDLRIQPAVPGGVLVFNSTRASATNASAVRVDRSVRVCTVPMCEPPLPTITPTPLPPATPTATPAPLPVNGTCLQPGLQGLVACNTGTTVTTFLCKDPSCARDALISLAVTQTDANGHFALVLDRSLVAGKRLIFDAAIVQAPNLPATTGRAASETDADYRIMDFGPVGAIQTLNVAIDPLSEAALGLMYATGLQNYTDAGIRDVIQAVRAAGTGIDFSGATPSGAVNLATETARSDQAVQDAVHHLCTTGDCHSDGAVTADELLQIMNIALGHADRAACPNGTPSGVGVGVGVTLLIEAVNNALSGCGG